MYNTRYIKKLQIKTTYVRNLQKDLDIQGKWAVENGAKINPGKER
jgi:hypothetical protein